MAAPKRILYSTSFRYLKMPGRRSRGRRGRRDYDAVARKNMDDGDLFFIARDRRRVRPDYILKAYWDLTAAAVSRYVAREVGAELGREVEVDIVMEVGGRPTVVAGNTMVCRPLPGRNTNHRPINPYEYVVRGE